MDQGVKYLVKTGAIFLEDPADYPNRMGQLNKKLREKNAPGQIYELYSSLRSSYSHLPTARPDFRLPLIDWEYLKKFVEACHANGLIFNYTMNANFVGNLTDVTKHYDEIVANIKRLEEEIKIDRITVSHPILLEIVNRNTNLAIECSTIMNINSIQAPAMLKSIYPHIDKICMGIDKNRNIEFVTKMNDECRKQGIKLEIMCSEFCQIGWMSCTQLHRNHCYNMHSMNMTEDEARNGVSTINDTKVHQPKEIAGYPWTSGKVGCIFNRSGDPAVWLNSKTIWPNEIERYCNMTGVEHIKITTRTAPADFAEYLTEAYASSRYDGPLAALWLALPASVLSARDNFDKIQNAGAKAAPYLCKDLSTPHKISMHVWYKDSWNHLEGEFTFMDLFFMFSDIDWSDIKWVDKPDQELEVYESNWIHKWHKMLIAENNA